MKKITNILMIVFISVGSVISFVIINTNNPYSIGGNISKLKELGFWLLFAVIYGPALISRSLGSASSSEETTSVTLNTSSGTVNGSIGTGRYSFRDRDPDLQKKEFVRTFIVLNLLIFNFSQLFPNFAAYYHSSVFYNYFSGSIDSYIISPIYTLIYIWSNFSFSFNFSFGNILNYIICYLPLLGLLVAFVIIIYRYKVIYKPLYYLFLSPVIAYIFHLVLSVIFGGIVI